jgi:hypothetical protein
MPTLSPRQISDEPESPPTRKTLTADSPLHPVSLAAGAGSAAVAAVIGGQLGLSGTVIGAAVGSIVAALTATTIRTSVRRSRAAAIALASRRRGGSDPIPAHEVAVAIEQADTEPAQTPWSGWVRGAVTVGAGFALGIAGLLLLQLGLGRNLSPGTDQLQSVAAKVVVASPTPTRAHASATATRTVTQTAPATASSSPTSGPTMSTVPSPSQGPSSSTTASATSSGVPTP